MKKLFIILLTTTALISFKSYAGPTGVSPHDPLVESYITISKLADSGNVNAIKNKNVIYSFLSAGQKDTVQAITNIKYEKLAMLKAVKIRKQ